MKKRRQIGHLTNQGVDQTFKHRLTVGGTHADAHQSAYNSAKKRVVYKVCICNIF